MGQHKMLTVDMSSHIFAHFFGIMAIVGVFKGRSETINSITKRSRRFDDNNNSLCGGKSHAHNFTLNLLSAVRLSENIN